MAIPQAVGDADTQVAEPDDVRPIISGHVGKKAGVAIHAPATRDVAEIGKTKPRIRSPEGAIAVAERGVNSGVAEAHDVGAFVTVYISKEPWMPVDPPPSSDVAEVGEDELWRLERAVAVAQRGPDPGVAEAYDVGPAVSGQIGKEPWVPVDPPPSSDVAEVLEDELWRLERAVAVAQRGPDPGVAEAYDVGPAVSGQIGKEPWVPVDPPPAGRVEVAEVAGEDELWRLERPVADLSWLAIAQRGPDSGVAEAYDVGPDVGPQIGEKAGVSIDAPASYLVPEVLEH